MKRKRRSRTILPPSKRSKSSGDTVHEGISSPVLIRYYSQVVPLKEWLLQHSPNLSRRRKKGLSDPAHIASHLQHGGEDEIATLLSDVLVGFTPGKTSIADHVADLKHFSQRSSAASACSTDNRTSSPRSDMNEVCFLYSTLPLRTSYYFWPNVVSDHCNRSLIS